MHVLIVDDTPDRMDRLMVAFLLKGWHATGSASMIVAHTCLRQAEIDVVLAVGDTASDVMTLAKRHQSKALRVVLGDDTGRPVPADIHRLIAHDTPPDDICRHVTRAQKARAARAPRVLPAKSRNPVFASVRTASEGVAQGAH